MGFAKPQFHLIDSHKSEKATLFSDMSFRKVMVTNMEQTLATRLRELRKVKQYTQEAAAKSIGIGRSAYCAYENGENVPPADKLRALAELYGVSVDYLLGAANGAENGAHSFGFYKIGCGVPRLQVANPNENVNGIKSLYDRAEKAGCSLLLLPELCLCGYTCADLFHQYPLLQACENALQELLSYTAGRELPMIVGLPVRAGGLLYNCAAVLKDGKLLGVVPKSYLAEGNEFYEKRWFASGLDAQTDSVTLCGQTAPFGRLLFHAGQDLVFGIELCQDLWVPLPPSVGMALQGANLILNLSASNETVAKAAYRESLVRSQSASLLCAYAYCGAGVTESTTDLVFGGGTLLCENGTLLASGKLFSREPELTCACIDVQKLNALRMQETTFADTAARHRESYTAVSCPIRPLAAERFDGFVDPYPFVPQNENQRSERCEEILQIQSAGLAKRLEHTHSRKAVVGVSGGLDSTLALLVSVRSMQLLGKSPSDVLGITMPGFGTTDRTYHNAIRLMHALGVTVREISIADACIRHMKDIGHDASVHDVTYENVQARERTQILMDVSNKEGGLLVGTGDLSEAAMGWCTYNADHMSMYGVNASVPKTLVRYLVDYVAKQSGGEIQELLADILDTPVSPELLPPDQNGQIAQKTEEKIGPYALHDFFLYHFFRFGFTPEKISFLACRAFQGVYDEQTVNHWLKTFLRRFFNAQFKRSCTPDAPKVGSVSLSPRGDWRMPSDASYDAWLLS